MPTNPDREPSDRADPAPKFPTRLSLDDARTRIVELAAARPTSLESIAIECSLGRVLAQDVRAPFDVPGFANSAMDGYAVRHADLDASESTRLHLLGVTLAGGQAAPAAVAGGCVRITTGARLPEGADTIVIKEDTTVDGNWIHVAAGARAGANVRAAGEDYRAGDLALSRGATLTPARIGALASFGMREIAVARKPRAVLLTTGDELVAPGQPLGAGQIHDSNRYSLGGLLEQAGVDLVRHERLRDEPDSLRAALARASGDAEMIMTSGGVSAGEADYLPGLLAQIGEVHFWKVRIKPGLPFLCGSIGRTFVFALPGNPVSGIATFLALVKPGIDAMIGRGESPPRLRARLAWAIHKHHDRTELLRATIECDASGVLHATPLPKQGSGMLAGVADASVLVRIPEAAGVYGEGFVVEILPLPTALG
ncbi:MAG: gephyrin-like molybdotransferase Glp [Rudaea sp.]